jgi:hypothetical protein
MTILCKFLTRAKYILYLKKNKILNANILINNGGDGEIRTLESFHSTHFPGVRTRPLCDISKKSGIKSTLKKKVIIPYV